MSRQYSKFSHAIDSSVRLLLQYGEEVDTGTWQGVKTDPSMVTKELMNLQFSVPVPRPLYPEPLLDLAEEIQPNLPWADDHFEERVSRVPSNPGEQYRNWPWWQGQHEVTAAHPDTGELVVGDINQAIVPSGFKFTHTYQERFWPKDAGMDQWGAGSIGPVGIRYSYGDLDDVVNLLLREPYTRQATFPIFFPEDTGAVHGGRIPCTLHYHFLMRNDQLHMWYPIRSCDAVRHFRDDVYLACRLMLWVLEECRRRCEFQGDWDNVRPGTLHFTAYSFHVHKGDLHHVQTA